MLTKYSCSKVFNLRQQKLFVVLWPSLKRRRSHKCRICPTRKIKSSLKHWNSSVLMSPTNYMEEIWPSVRKQTCYRSMCSWRGSIDLTAVPEELFKDKSGESGGIFDIIPELTAAVIWRKNIKIFWTGHESKPKALKQGPNFKKLELTFKNHLLRTIQVNTKCHSHLTSGCEDILLWTAVVDR